MSEAIKLDRDYELSCRYTRDHGKVFLTGIQALVRLPLLQARMDRAQGLKTAGLISGYRGSPLGGYDQELWRAEKYLHEADIRFEPGLNEDLAATALWGSQQIASLGNPRVQGVFGIWYGKGPGVDRSLDVLRHANMFGTSKYGGVLAMAGDDHAAASSVIPHQTDQVLAAALIPELNPATVAEYIEYGLIGFALSRFTGSWVGFKCATETVESGSVVELPSMMPRFETPADFVMPPHGLNYDPTLEWPGQRMELERRMYEERVPAIFAFARANNLDRVVFGPENKRDRRFGLVTTGKGHAEAMEALRLLGIDEAEARRIGLAVYKIGMSWPLEETRALDFCDGLQRVLIVEEKRMNVEYQLMHALYNVPDSKRPQMAGKEDFEHKPLLSYLADLNPDGVADAIVRILGPAMEDGGARWRKILDARKAAHAQMPSSAGLAVRRPFFCSGCPHNTSTRTPEGSKAGAGIGCHILTMGSRNTANVCQMGGEGVFWVGAHSFVDRKHFFQNMGDGTYQHSGILAIRQAIAAKAPMTYKILYNDAVAMTGGQPAEGGLSPQQIAKQVAAEGVERIYLISDHPEKFASGQFPPSTEILHRDELDRVQQELEENASDVSVIIYEQTCATEKRRRRKRGTLEDPKTRVFINDRVCEGCGDCSVKSNCISVEPTETEFGTKRRINQSSCNKDYSCINGFCPSFVTVEAEGLRKPDSSHVGAQEAALFDRLPAPDAPKLTEPYNILVTGIGGTGVVTIGQVLAMAGHLEGKGATVLDHTGLAQKNGSVVSHIRLGPDMSGLTSASIIDGETDLLLACDMLTGAASGNVAKLSKHRTASLINNHEAPTAGFVQDSKHYSFPAERATRIILDGSNGNASDVVAATALSTALFGDAIFSNPLMLGVAFQKGLIPLSAEAIERAMELNGVAVAANKRAFRWGRASVIDPEAVQAVADGAAPRAPEPAKSLDDVIGIRTRELVSYQNQAYADRYRGLVDRAAAADMRATGERGRFTEAVARFYYKLMAYKDEYEVARLHADPVFQEKLRAQFSNWSKIKVFLAPPLLARPDPLTGEPKKMSFGPWVFRLFGVMQHFKFLRGGPLDIFGMTAERKMERRLIAEYERDMERVIAALNQQNYDAAVSLARVPDDIRGYGHIKDRNIALASKKAAELRARFDADGGRAPQPRADAA